MSTQPGHGWAWKFNDFICHWAEPTREQLLAGSKPTPEAKPVYVAIVPMGLWKSTKKTQNKITKHRPHRT